MASTHKLSFADYLALADPDLERPVELIDRELIELSLKSGLNSSIDTKSFL